ncbi:MAG: zinc-finger domain-containing protein [Alphaproteobacteria bacterium HGW-Alphaproteobacteria-11]|nr:MAG: zinc-finger domain-containing protein [Alphaproteobacteria bacterium HGW-Alphaproteobacteria-11]
MAGAAVPKFSNEAGAREIAIGVKEFTCIGANPPFDHPHIWLDMGADTEIVCPYCSTLYRFDAALGAHESRPAGAAWHEKLSA